MQGTLLIQTASIGDVILITPVMEKLNHYLPDESIDILVKKGNETLFYNHPFIRTVLVWDKTDHKYRELFRLLKNIRSRKYTRVINFQRFASTGLLTAFSGADTKIGFDKNPLSFLFNVKVKHCIYPESILHETDRNQKLVEAFTGTESFKPALYPSANDRETVNRFMDKPYICIAPASLWFTKQYPSDRWVEFINSLPLNYSIYLIGAGNDRELCNLISTQCSARRVTNLAGQLNMLQSAALMKNAVMNYVNDSAPMHLASAVNAPVTAVYCSTIPEFGFGPLSDQSCIIQVTDKLECRPCGLHGHRTCPEGHFRCATDITVQQLLNCLPR